MSEVIVASTTDSQSEVNAAAGGKPQDETIPDAKPAPTGHPEVENDPEAPPVEAKEPEKQDEEAIPKGVQKRIDKFRAQLTAAQKEIEALKSKSTPEPETKKEPPVVPTEVAAKFDTFDSWSEKQLAAGKTASLDDFLEQRDAWKEARDAQKAEQDAIAKQDREVVTEYNRAVKAAKEVHPDWDDVVGAMEFNSAIAGPQEGGRSIFERSILEMGEIGTEVTYFLATHEDALDKLNEMSLAGALREIGRLAAKLEKPAPEETPTNNVTTRNPDRSPIVSKAPTPITPLKGGGVRPSKDISAPDISYEEYRKIRDEQAKTIFRR